jgi:hypothetical protein
MRMPDKLKNKDKNDKDNKEIKENINYFGTVHFYNKSLTEEKEFLKFIKNTEKIIRSSFEMKNYISYLKYELNLDTCLFFKNVSAKDTDIELHHYPFTLFEITLIVSNHLARTQADRFSSFLLAEEVIKLHYKNYIGLVPLSKTLHELAHNGKLIIPIHTVFGKIDEFIKLYKDYISEDVIKKIRILLDTPEAVIQESNKELLKIKPIMNPESILESYIQEKLLIEKKEE